MTIEATFDFAARQVSRALGDVIVWRPETAYEQDDVKAVLDHGFEEVTGPRGIRVNSRHPAVTVALSDLDTAPAKGHQLEVRGERFEVLRIEDDVEAVSARLHLKQI